MTDSSSLLNLTQYPPHEMMLFAGGCLMWVVAYAIIIRNGIKHQIIEMPVFAAASNFAWEFLWGTVFQTDMGQFLVWTYRSWLILDIFIFYMVLKYGARQISTPIVKKYFKTFTLAAMFGMMLLYYLFTHEGFDTSIGANSAYICQLFISALYIIMILREEDLTGYSLSVAWLRSVGTGLNTVFMILHYPDYHFLHAMGLIALSLDAVCITIFTLRRANKFNLSIEAA